MPGSSEVDKVPDKFWADSEMYFGNNTNRSLDMLFMFSKGLFTNFKTRFTEFVSHSFIIYLPQKVLHYS